MDPQTPTINAPPASDPVAPNSSNQQINQPTDRHGVTIAAMALFVLLSLAAVTFLYYQNQQLKSMLSANLSPSPAASQSPTPNPNEPVVSSPSAGTKATSPMKVSGTVPAGWMFEGVFPIKLTDANGKLIVQGQGKEVTPGSWQSGNPVDFTATLTFKTASTSGFLVLENDNPSGDPSKLQTYKIPVGINCTPRPACLDATPRCLIPETADMCPAATTTPAACTQEARLCPDGSYVGRTGPSCEFAACPTP